MIDLALRNIKRQKTRTMLTVVGIVIGITAVVALGSFAEGINQMVSKELNSVSGRITVSEKGASISNYYSTSSISQEQIENMKSVSGVSDVIPISFFIPGSFGIGAGPPKWIAIGVDIDKLDVLMGENIAMDEGSRYNPGEHEVAIIGSSVAEDLNLKVGDFITIKETDFLITGITEKTGQNDIDLGVIVPLEDLQLVLGSTDYQLAYVMPENPQIADAVADEINSQDDTLSALTAKDLANQASEIIGTVRIFTFGVGGVAAFVGGLGVMNTMIMAVMERRRELGVMKAVGATKRMLVVQIITESSAISLTGGLIGLLLGWLASLALGLFTGGLISGIVTPGLAAISILFALCLGVFGGLYPAWRAAKLDPVDALRY